MRGGDSATSWDQPETKKLEKLGRVSQLCCYRDSVEITSYVSDLACLSS